MSAHKVKIIARIRPKIHGELDDDSIKFLHTSDNNGDQSAAGASFVTVPNPRDPTQIFKFPFSSCYDQNSTQEAIYHNDVEPLLDVIYSGITVTIFAYGVTSSGKTFTMQGTKTEPGVIPLVVKGIFDKKQIIRNWQTHLTVSYMEIYKDEVYDLLVARENAPKLPVRENDSGMVFVANLSRIPISSVGEFENIYHAANKRRSVGSTNLNRASSRSHAILIIEVTLLDPVTDTTLTGKINLVDLAGSENNKLTGNDPARMAESAAINKSLSVLGQVVHALNQGASRIPYRNSKLTRILQDALGGSSVDLLICNIAPGIKFRQDTLNTLNFAARTKNVENRPVVNEHHNRPALKPRFSALPAQPPLPKPAAAVIQSITTTGSNSGGLHSRFSLVPVAKGHRMSSIGVGIGYQPLALPAVKNLPVISSNKEGESDRSGNNGFGLTEKEIDERISKAVEAAVEAEVARRLAEREKQRLEGENHETRENLKPDTIPSGVLTPLLKRHKDLDSELIARLQELERKYERGTKESQLADVLSPVSKKKTGRAYVALARAHSEKGDLQVALDLYRKAETYVPDNIKLKERIIEIDWAVKNNKEYIPSPKPKKKGKKSKSNTNTNTQDKMNVDNSAEGSSQNGRSTLNAEFGMEVTNTESPGNKRSLTDIEVVKQTPRKRRKRSALEVPS